MRQIVTRRLHSDWKHDDESRHSHCSWLGKKDRLVGEYATNRWRKQDNLGEKSIRITLIHNPDAGTDSRPTDDDIVKLIRAAGHKVRYQSSKEKKCNKALKNSSDIVAIAGGDGTVDKVARELIGSPHADRGPYHWEPPTTNTSTIG